MKFAKIALPLLLSACIGVILCLTLLGVGAIKIEHNPETPVTAPLSMNVANSDPANSDTNGEIEEKKNMVITSPEYLNHNHSRQTMDLQLNQHKIEGKDVYQRSIAFLSLPENMGASDLQQRFEQFLTAKMNLDTNEVEQLLRMSFWKSFVCLQQDWNNSNWLRLNTLFENEKALKKAGFKAMGIDLMDSIVSDAELSVFELKEKMDHQTAKGEPV
ncbi:hypothetical protein DSCO28_36520 [Desulfosarcina ovata subsp. sediminis]|uniref:Uncharacterized protein n=1 Tax=Desulfosarcina ovata subsp. sediminis TaxID=885957 RepID=A0A5K7ZS97_9BACT|nr:hypothetical protein [Desulfosarcina ovata]BBO83086.1 hypothetical protein DSCO28_36520 [Desulfosarcina ovata subsp. sediminis]